LLLCAFSFSLAGAFGETVVLQLRNGDRVTGTIVSENTNHIVINTSWAKDLLVPVPEILKREKMQDALTAANSSPAKPGETIPLPMTLPSPRVNAVVPEVPKFVQRQSWHGRIDIGMDLGFSESNRELFYGKAKITYIPQFTPGEIKTLPSRFRNTFDVQATYGRNNGILSANLVNGASKTDWDIREKFFVYNLFGLGYDEIRRIDFQYEEGPGVGYHWIKRSNFVLNTELGMNYQVQNFQGGIETQRFFARLAEDATWTVSKKMTLDERFEFFPNVQGTGDFRLRFESNLRFALWQNISLTLSLIDAFDTQPAPGVSKNDLQIRSLIGVVF
jgi:hypothetical protein